jgi:hypothetical protein
MEEKKQLGIKFNITATIKDAKTGKIKRIYKNQNLIATVGRSVIAQRLANVLVYTGVINYGALGTSVTPPADGNTQLENEVFRKAVASATYSANVAYITFFYTATEVSGTFREFGNFIDGTAVVNTGQLFSRVAVNWTKTLTESLTLDCTYTITYS